MSDPKHPHAIQYGTIAVAVAAAGLMLLMVHPFTALATKSFTFQDCAAFFTELTAIALFVERSLEVLVTPWRERGAQLREVEHDAAKTKLEVVQKAAVQAPEIATAAAPNAVAEAVSTKQAVVDYRASTQQIAFVVSLCAGIVISLVGVRALEFFFDPKGLSQLGGLQRRLFQATDVVLTGALISGGADALHQLVTVFTNFANATSEKVKGS